MKKTAHFLMALLLGLTITTCSKDTVSPDKLIKLSTEVLQFSPTGDETKHVTINSTSIWLLIPPDQLPDWITMNPINGYGNADDIEITIADANGTGARREHELVFRTINGGSASLRVVQPVCTDSLYAITVLYTNNHTKRIYAASLNNVVFNTNGPGDVVKSITDGAINGGDPVLIGRYAGETVRLSFDTQGDLQFRNAVRGVRPIGSYAEFQLINSDRYGRYQQEADLDLLNEEWFPIGYYNPVTSSFSSFTGVYNGNGYHIDNLNVNRNRDDFTGLFGYISGDLFNVHITSGSVKGMDFTGGICGFSGYGSIENCSNEATVIGRTYTGGLIGYNYNGMLIASYNNGSVTGDSAVGGLVGNNNGGSIMAGYNNGTIRGREYLGGITGTNIHPAFVAACYNTGSVRGSGITGVNTGMVIACYWQRGRGATSGVINTGDGESIHLYFFDTTFDPSGTHATWGIGNGEENRWWKNYNGNGGLPVLWWE